MRNPFSRQHPTREGITAPTHRPTPTGRDAYGAMLRGMTRQHVKAMLAAAPRSSATDFYAAKIAMAYATADRTRGGLRYRGLNFDGRFLVVDAATLRTVTTVTTEGHAARLLDTLNAAA